MIRPSAAAVDVAPAAMPARRAPRSPARRWARALELTAPIVGQPQRLLSDVVDERAQLLGSAPAILSDRECLTYRALVDRSRRYARWALDQGLAKGAVVALMMPNRPEYLPIWLGITRVGGVVALLNTNLAGPALAHCINTVAPAHLIVAAELVERVRGVRRDLAGSPQIWMHGGRGAFPSIDDEIAGYDNVDRVDAAGCGVTIDDPALYIYTSGTTGLPKAAIVTHGRIMQWSHWFAGLMDARPDDRLYDCLPMYHSVGGVLAPGVMLAAGASVVIRDGFSARHFWRDVVRWDCTLFQYIGELCRYLLHTPPDVHDRRHHIRLCCGNGLRADVWHAFRQRFRIPEILEFYASTEGNVSLANVEGLPGAVGRIPPYLAHRFPAALVKHDADTGELARDADGFCIRCAPNEVGEALGAVPDDRANIASRFDGYTSRDESERKIVRDVFRPGDVWFRTGDLMRQDDRGFFSFVDRLGDTFRWKGENVSTAEVSDAINRFPGVRETNVYGVEIPGSEGRAGMATIVAESELDLAAFRQHLTDRLPEYAHPMFLRIRSELDVTATFKHTKHDLVREAYDPRVVKDPIYFNDRTRQAFVPMDESLYDRIQNGAVRS